MSALSLVWVNREQLDYEREMKRQRARLIVEGLCICCELPGAEHIDSSGLPICGECARPRSV